MPRPDRKPAPSIPQRPVLSAAFGLFARPARLLWGRRKQAIAADRSDPAKHEP